MYRRNMQFAKYSAEYLVAAVLVIALATSNCHAELTPPYFNLAEGRHISATATCGVGSDGPELYCKLVGANTENDVHHNYSLVQGQICDNCDASNPDRAHPPEFAINGKSNWWQSPPLSRGMKYNEVNLTIDFGQTFHVAYLYIRMGNSPRPGLWSLEKSSDYGKTWTAWQHFSDSPADCETFFGIEESKRITRDDDVICTTEYSKIVPLEDGEIPIVLLNNRPSKNNYFNSTVLQEWTRATNVRFRFLRTKTLLGHLMSVARQDPTVTRRYFYSIKDISIGGRCMCNGHADTCDVLDPHSPTRILACQCRHNTAGIHCNECKPGFEQKKWRQNTKLRPFQCEPCNCHGHSNTCEYDEKIDEQYLSLDVHGKYEGGGVCKNCQHNTEGINCNKCKAGFYRPEDKHWNETDVCQPCDCNLFNSTGNCEEGTGRCECRKEFQEPHCLSCSFNHFGYPDCRPCDCNFNGTDGNLCEAENGRCPCKENFAGDFCDRCAEGYYGPDCLPCECDPTGSVHNVCDANTGQCLCNPSFDDKHCDSCKDGYHSYPSCLYSNCDSKGTIEEISDKFSGECLCAEGYGGSRCDQCLPTYYNYPDCVKCNCSTVGSAQVVCGHDGKCPCLNNFAGKQCTQCSAGYYQYPECLSCNCGSRGSNGVSCNADGQCSCFENYDGKTCDACKEGFYNYPNCEACNCDPAGVIAKFAGCGSASVPVGELCECKDRVAGRICNECKPLYWNLTLSNPLGCQECDCNTDGTLGQLDTCNSKTGQCPCRPSVAGRICDQCKDGTYGLHLDNLFGCKDCDCDIGGSIHSVCNKEGQCKCHPRVTGHRCSQPITTHYFPTLHQLQYEFEDGYTQSGALVRYEFDEEQFPGFSKRGYAKFTKLQTEIINEVNIQHSTFYRIVIRYVNPTEENILATLLITSDNPAEESQGAKILFPPSAEPQFVTVSGSKGDIPSTIVLDPGRYTVSVKTDKFVYLDYFVLLPAAYYEATILARKIENPCEIGDLTLCRHYNYPNIDEYHSVETAYNANGNNPNELYTDNEHLRLVKSKPLPLLNELQQSLTFEVDVRKPGKYILVVDYITDRNNSNTYTIKVEGNETDGSVALPACLYTMVCRQPVIDDLLREQIFDFPSPVQRIQLITNDDTYVAIKSITAIPIEEWSLDLITPSPVCVTQDGECIESAFWPAPDSKKIEFANFKEPSEETIPSELPNNDTQLVYLGPGSSTVEVKTKVEDSGRYAILVKFYQPNHARFDILYKIDADKLSYDGKLNLRNCPSNSGCRGIILQNNGAKSFDLEENVTITLTNPRAKGVWLENVLIVSEPQFNDKLLEEQTFDQTKEFIQKCGQNHFHVQLNATAFCKQAVFSLTADFNRGALPCNCDYEGSTSFECDPFGGQCQCKSNIIGRTCDACRTGYYGFPDCKPCDCPSSSLCERDTGACICPPHVTGEKCDKCEPYSYGFDHYFGCELCNCNSLGVQNNELQCDINNGTCACGPNIEGRMCDKCFNGHFNFPFCQQCRCSVEGTVPEVCDQQDETCFCKKNVVGNHCDQCIDGTYNMQGANPEGCTKCFCFGKTTRCERAYLRGLNVSMLREVSINTIVLTPLAADIQRWAIAPQDLMLNESTAETDLSNQKPEDLVYFGVLDYLLDQKNHLSAYGGHLTYTLRTTASLFGKSAIGPDIILEGKESTILHQSYRQPASNQNFYGTLKIVESSFTTLNGEPVTREQLMYVLKQLNAIYIRAAYWDKTDISQLSDVYLEMADHDEENYDLYEELAVEKCRCPAGYTGNSCEDCATGYYRDALNGPHGGYCVPCQCNSHAGTCDVNTGICNECKHSTTGDHCHQCIKGYYGNATNGDPNDCLICACPLPIEGNNFAIGCEVSEDGQHIRCECEEGYTGETCQSCARGYFGDPTALGGFCQPCNCSGNIDPLEEGACDSVTGSCLKCKNNTFGKACELCSPMHYGDAINLKDCQSCLCDQTGTAVCDSYSGTCNCLPNVIGSKCDRCEEDHYGFDSKAGCSPCECAVASNSTQCDDHSGNCRCKPGVTGRQCDECMPGFWNYTSEGCLPCSCNNDYSRGVGCNVLTGQCACLTGVVGEKCDACPERWVLVPDRGCHICDDCHHALLNVTDWLEKEIDPVTIEFQSIASGFFTSQKLTHFDDLTKEIEPKVSALDPNGVNLTPHTNSIEKLEADAKQFERDLRNDNVTAYERRNSGNQLLNDSQVVLQGSSKTFDNIQNTIYEVVALGDSLEDGQSGQIDNQLNEANNILEHLKEFKLNTVPSENELQNSEQHLENIENFIKPVKEHSDKLDKLRSANTNFTRKLDDITNRAREAIKLSHDAAALHSKNKNAPVNAKFETVGNHTKETENNIQKTQRLGKEGDITLGEIFHNVFRLDNVLSQLKAMNDDVDKEISTQAVEYDQLKDIIERAGTHREYLSDRADKLKEELSNIEANSEQALKAANAYIDIVNNVADAQNAIKQGRYDAGNATELTSGLEDRAGRSDQVSRNLLKDAVKSLSDVQSSLQPHTINSTSTVNQIKDLNAQSEKKIVDISSGVEREPQKEQSKSWRDARDKAIEASEQTNEANAILHPILSTVEDDANNAKQLSKKIGDTTYDIDQTTKNVDTVRDILPKINELVDDLKHKQAVTGRSSSDLGARIESLKKQIEAAREIANSIKVGLRFHPNTTLELQPPPSLAQLALDTRVSAYFKTEKPNGFLMYLGNGNKNDVRYGKQNDFMALEIENGYPILHVDLGNGPEKIISNKNVANGKWHQVIVERHGNDVKLTIREPLEDGTDRLHETSEKLLDSQPIFDVKPENSRIFVGGYPSDFNPQEGLKYNSFEGEIEDLSVGDTDIGLWNFIDGQNNRDGSAERDQLLSSEVQPTGYRFTGHGYVILDSRSYTFKQRSNIQFEFKASPDSANGLMFYAGRDKHFISVELRDGGVLFQYKMGQHLVSIGTTEQYNDDKWHRVEAAREGRVGILKIDDSIISQEESPHGSEENLKVSETMYFGGHPEAINHTEVVKQNFDGCIDKVFISGTPVDLSRRLKAYQVRPGCAKKFSTTLSYAPLQYGYLRHNISTANTLVISLKFKTKQDSGIIFYATDSSQENTFALSLSKGALELRGQGVEISTHPTKFDDSTWHYLTATFAENRVRLSVDHAAEIVSDESGQSILFENADIYFGGLPKGFTPKRIAIGPPAYFVGCISDVLVNGPIVNFADSVERKQAILDNCARDLLDYDPSFVPLVYPVDEAGPSTSNIDQSGSGKPGTNQQPVDIDIRHGDGDDDDNIIDPHRQDKHLKPLDEYLTTTTTVRPTRRRPNKIDPICKLPVEPELDVDFDSGYRFGTVNESRIEFYTLPERIEKKINMQYDFALEFRTDQPNGLLFYVADSRHSDFIGLYLEDGYVIHKFNCGSGTASMASNKQYNDDNWHTVRIERHQKKGKLIIDGEDDVSGESFGGTRKMSLQPPYSFGGIRANLTANNFKANLGINQVHQFSGCIRHIQIGDRPWVSNEENIVPIIEGAIPCSDKVEQGIFFSGGFVKLKDRFRVGNEASISFDIKPRTLNGLLLSVHGKHAMLALQLVNGSIVFTVDNGEGPLSSVYKPEGNQNFCDGEWHTVTALKSQFVITLVVDNVNTTPTVGSPTATSTNTTRPLYLGGHPHLSRVRGLSVRKPFVGCIRNVRINKDVHPISLNMAVGKVQTGVCPLN